MGRWILEALVCRENGRLLSALLRGLARPSEISERWQVRLRARSEELLGVKPSMMTEPAEHDRFNGIDCRSAGNSRRHERILFVNPNTSTVLTDHIGLVARQYAQPSTVVSVRNPTCGPQLIGSVYDELLSVRGTLSLVHSEVQNHDAFVIACYSDHPAIYAIREITDKPVLGIAEASMYAACVMGRQFSIVTTGRRWEALLWTAVHRYGLSERCASIRATGSAPLPNRSNAEDRYLATVLEVAREAVCRDGAEAICLGGAVMAGMHRDLQHMLKVPVLDGVVCALLLLQAMLG
jgi:allantoin racemase